MSSVPAGAARALEVRASHAAAKRVPGTEKRGGYEPVRPSKASCPASRGILP
jgi:hypothetical protein